MCKEIDFPILTLENFPYFDDLSQEILLNTEVTVSSNTILCTGPGLYFKDEYCISYLINNRRNKKFIRDKSELTKFLVQSYPDKTLYLIANDTSYYVTPLPNGITGCLGSYVKSNETVNKKYTQRIL